MTLKEWTDNVNSITMITGILFKSILTDVKDGYAHVTLWNPDSGTEHVCVKTSQVLPKTEETIAILMGNKK